MQLTKLKDEVGSYVMSNIQVVLLNEFFSRKSMSNYKYYFDCIIMIIDYFLN